MSILGELEKMLIYKLDDKGNRQGEPIKVTINPEGYKESFSVEYNQDQEANSSGKKPKFVKVKPGDFTFKLLFDATGIFEIVDLNLTDTLNSIAADIAGFNPFQDDQASEKNVVTEIDKIKELVTYKGEMHMPYELEIAWGSLNLKCFLIKLDIDYKLFNTKGYPIRAVATLTCKDSTADKLRQAAVNKQSPDLTHIRRVQEGDTLPLMSYRIYGDPKYYLEVARVNNLLNFRNIEPGTELFFPPLNKTQSA
ncbi:LysM peptidoglycan-binding domain-containing protein [Kordia sp.]|uniref:CIS tube protein n=1 Tax=Kordia sp. TaxID=1965332 RepID=UPI0025BF63E2|nr:LysM peptidoglycan-binding domain-containing protein [Kordia sp.]MCH2193503.1 LysM peptidoglycan-binding domain-containing protein [Kordia sp.]